MGIRDWFGESSAKGARLAGTGRRFPVGTPAFEVAGTDRLTALFRIGEAARDDAWTAAFWEAAWSAAAVVADPPVFTGPDGFPYLRLNLPGEAPSFEANSLMNVAASLVDQGLGAAFFALPAEDHAAAQYVLSMGVLDSILRFDCPDGEPFEIEEGREPPPADQIETVTVGGAEHSVLKAGQEVLVGTPSERYLSAPAARALHRHLVEGWGIADPRVALIVIPAMRPTRSLVIGKSVAQFQAEGVDEALMKERLRMLSWYLPPSRRLMLMPDDWTAETMTPLLDLCAPR